ncbi:probable serine hydrolase isoform X1 [Macrobrachium rosenbergii]|uniref:probable serine hydrolase isoform X1 n=1 Tax=Macrobrachium rosenbergii TaxID=79674 RepID=UPI0034D5FB58
MPGPGQNGEEIEQVNHKDVIHGEAKENANATSCPNTPHNVKKDAWEWEEVEIDIEWGILRGKQRGSGPRLILGIHGWLDNANTFDLIAPMLPQGTQFLSLDLPGHGNSDHFPPGFIYDPRGYMGAVKKAVKVLGWERFILLGHSMGAVVGILYTAVFPEDVEAFISIDIIKPWSSPPEKYAAQFAKYFNQYFDHETKARQDPLVYEEHELVRKTIEGSKSLDERGARILLNRGARTAENGGLILKRDLRAKVYFIGFVSFEAWVELARCIKCPLLFVKANEGHKYETPERYDIMLAAFEQDCHYFSCVELEGKHHVHLTHPETVGTYINSFIEKCDSMLHNGASNVNV